MWTKVLWAPSPHQADGQLSGVVRASVSVRGTLVGGFFGWLSMSNRRLLFGNAEWLFSRGKEKGKPFEPIAVISMISPTEPWTFADLIRNILNQKQIYYQEWCQKMLLTHNKGFFLAERYFLSHRRCRLDGVFKRSFSDVRRHNSQPLPPHLFLFFFFLLFWVFYPFYYLTGQSEIMTEEEMGDDTQQMSVLLLLCLLFFCFFRHWSLDISDHDI